MNFVHFPKLHDYALDPELVKEPAQFGHDKTGVRKLVGRHVTFPGVSQNKTPAENQSQSLAKQHSRDGRSANDIRHSQQIRPLRSHHETTSYTFVDTAKRNRRRLDERSDDLDSRIRSQFFQRWRELPLPIEGLNFSVPGNDVVEDGLTVGNSVAGRSGEPSTGDHKTKDTAADIPTNTSSHPITGQENLPENERPDQGGRLPKVRTQVHNSPDVVVQTLSPGLSKPVLKFQATKQKAGIKGKLLHRFKRVTLAIVNVLKLAKAIIKRTDSPSALLKTFTAMSREPEKEDLSENMKNYGLHFDPSYFRANKEISISSEVKGILRLPPSHRSTEQIQTAMFGLQSLPSFAEYPLHMQEKLTKVAWYEIVTPMRTIIKQGHFAENFYFILAGQAVVTIAKPGETTTQTAAIMRKGTSFGELALLHHSRRTATVTSHDTVQLLSVGREDFFDIFMSGHGRDQIPDHIKFISQMDFMKDWPLERLLERPDQCLLHFFKRNMVIVKDSRLSEWLYVVKSGSCQVLKQLRGVCGNLGPPRSKSLTSRGKMDIHMGGARRSELRPTTGGARTKRPASSAKRKISSSPLGFREATSSTLTTHDPSPDQPVELQPLQEERPQQPVFVQIELLKPKDVFGLDLVNFNSNLDLVNFNSNLGPNPTSVSLVSLGAECIMLSKSFFVKHVSQHLRKRISETIRPYPDEDSMQESLQTKVNWELYKKSLILKVMAQKYSVLNRGRDLMTN